MMHERVNARSMAYTEGARMSLAYMPCLASAMPIMIVPAPYSVKPLRCVLFRVPATVPFAPPGLCCCDVSVGCAVFITRYITPYG